MIVRPLLKTMVKFYKRNPCLLLPSLIQFASTNKYNNKMEETNELAAKVEQVTITGTSPLINRAESGTATRSRAQGT